MSETSAFPSFTTVQGALLEPVPFHALSGIGDDDLFEAMQVFLTSCRRIVTKAQPLRLASPESDDLKAVCRLALDADIRNSDEAIMFFAQHFSPIRVVTDPNRPSQGQGFATGYYEPEVSGTESRSEMFSEPVLRRPNDLVNVSTVGPDGKPQFSASRLMPDGSMAPYPTRAEIEAGRIGTPCLWLEDAIELFMIQVQGSARVRLPDGRVVRLVYDGRNGRPYTSIGRILVTEKKVPLQELSLDRLKAWVREAGQRHGEAGRELLHRNESYIFFKVEPEADASSGPIGGEGVPLFPMRSLAVDRGSWAYGTPVWLSGNLPGGDGTDVPFHRLMIAQDTGSAIVGSARCDIFVGRGDMAGQCAAQFRHPVDFFVFLPKMTFLRR